MEEAQTKGVLAKLVRCVSYRNSYMQIWGTYRICTKTRILRCHWSQWSKKENSAVQTARKTYRIVPPIGTATQILPPESTKLEIVWVSHSGAVRITQRNEGWAIAKVVVDKRERER